MSGISNHYIESILQPTCQDFRGVFSSNNIPKYLQNSVKFSIVCNLSKIGELGSHFITIISQPNYVAYIDSLGLPCSVLEINKFLHKLEKPIYFNKTQIQDTSSTFCGFFCILFVLHFSISSTPIKFDNEDLCLNDAFCIEQICEILK